MTRNEAVERLQRSGFVAFKRDWAFGETVCASTGMHRDGKIICYPDILVLYPVSGGWRIDNDAGPGDETARGDESTNASLEEAVAEAETRLQRMKSAGPET